MIIYSGATLALDGARPFRIFSLGLLAPSPRGMSKNRLCSVRAVLWGHSGAAAQALTAAAFDNGGVCRRRRLTAAAFDGGGVDGGCEGSGGEGRPPPSNERDCVRIV